ncbi:MAG: substrate-binding domain-containing protein [Gammaproteobacteria bacterium]|nr:substrate-binding domain-containing protein [Gammaproteobacteria bacterium]
MFTRKILKTTLTAAMGLTMLVGTAAQALWTQYQPETEIITQFHGDPTSAQLRLFMAGNQFVVMDNLIAEFKAQYPAYQEIYYVTIPPGKELQWILQEGAEWKAADFPKTQVLDKSGGPNPEDWVMQTTTDEEGVGFKMLDMPDVYTTVARGHMNRLGTEGLVKEIFTYTHNQLAVMAHTTQVSALSSIAEDDSALFPSKDGFNVDGELTAEGLYRLFASGLVTISEPDIKTQGIERHIWRMYTNATHAAFGCPGSGLPVCSVAVNDVFTPGADTCANNGGPGGVFDGESDDSLRKIVYQLKRCDEGPYASPSDGTTFVTSVHHLETPANINEGVGIARLTVGPVWGTEVEFQQFRRNNPDIVAMRIDDSAGPDGQALNRSDHVNYLAAKMGTGAKKNKQAAEDFLDFLKSDEAQVILERAGFIPATQDELDTVIPLSEPEPGDD